MATSRIFMVRPAHFQFNEETSGSNVFQQKVGLDPQIIQENALLEFDNFVGILREAGIQVDVLEDDADTERPDAIYPNNWMSTHPDQILITYPMYAPARRLERNERHIDDITQKYHVTTHIAMEGYETENMYLEGTGSMVLDHEYRMAYACKSARTDAIPFFGFCKLMNFIPVLFEGNDEDGIPLYHTNILMALGPEFVVINRSAVLAEDWHVLENFFVQTRKEIIEISHSQMKAFLGNMISLKDVDGHPCIVMSASAEAALEAEQRKALNKYGRWIVSDISLIEQVGGGSVRCMIAENYLLPRNQN